MGAHVRVCMCHTQNSRLEAGWGRGGAAGVEEAAVAAHVAGGGVGPSAQEGFGHGAVVAHRLEVALGGGADLSGTARFFGEREN